MPSEPAANKPPLPRLSRLSRAQPQRFQFHLVTLCWSIAFVAFALACYRLAVVFGFEWFLALSWFFAGSAIVSIYVRSQHVREFVHTIFVQALVILMVLSLVFAVLYILRA